MRNLRSRLLALFSLVHICFTLLASSAHAADGYVGNSSTGSVYLSLRIGASEIGLLPNGISSELRTTSSASFPVCIGYIDSEFVSINVADLNQGGMALTSDDGSKISYQISLGAESGLVEAKVKTARDSSCATGSDLNVNVTLLPTANQQDLTSIKGTFNFLVKSE